MLPLLFSWALQCLNGRMHRVKAFLVIMKIHSPFLFCPSIFLDFLWFQLIISWFHISNEQFVLFCWILTISPDKYKYRLFLLFCFDLKHGPRLKIWWGQCEGFWTSFLLTIYIYLTYLNGFLFFPVFPFLFFHLFYYSLLYIYC